MSRSLAGRAMRPCDVAAHLVHADAELPRFPRNFKVESLTLVVAEPRRPRCRRERTASISGRLEAAAAEKLPSGA